MSNHCKYVEDCTFSDGGIVLEQNIIDNIRKVFCYTDKKRECIRYKMAQEYGIQAVPFTIKPNDTLKEKEERNKELLSALSNQA